MTTVTLLITGVACTARIGAAGEQRKPLDSSVARLAPAAKLTDVLAAVEVAVEAAVAAFRQGRTSGPADAERCSRGLRKRLK